MHFIYGTITFVVVALLYLHIVSQYKTGNDLEIYEMDYTDATSLQETCNVLQPVIFEWKAKLTSPIKFMETCKFPMYVKDTREYYNQHLHQHPDSICLLCSSVIKLIRQDEKSHYFSESNQTFIEDSGFLKHNKYLELDRVLKPSYTVHSEYDVLMGSKGTSVPLRYHTNTRKFLYVISGKLSIKMTTWKNREWINVVKDFENYDFRSPQNVWLPDNDLEDTIQFLRFDVMKGSILYIPPFWFYSIQYDSEDTVVLEYNYSTLVNKVAFAADVGQYYLQQQNITTKATKRIYTHISQINDIVDEEIVTEETEDPSKEEV